MSEDIGDAMFGCLNCGTSTVQIAPIGMHWSVERLGHDFNARLRMDEIGVCAQCHHIQFAQGDPTLVRWTCITPVQGVPAWYTTEDEAQADQLAKEFRVKLSDCGCDHPFPYFTPTEVEQLHNLGDYEYNPNAWEVLEKWCVNCNRKDWREEE